MESECRNVIVIGPTDTGKSTVVSKIVMKSDNFSYPSKVYELHKVEKTIDNKNYKIEIIDVVGLELASLQRRIIGLKELMKGQKINLVIFVIKANRLNGDDHTILESVTDNFNLSSKLSSISALVITYCEGQSEEKRKSIKREFEEIDYTNKLGNFMKRGIITTGFATPGICNDHYLKTLDVDNKKELKEVHKLIAEATVTVEATELFCETWVTKTGLEADNKTPELEEVHKLTTEATNTVEKTGLFNKTTQWLGTKTISTDISDRIETPDIADSKNLFDEENDSSLNPTGVRGFFQENCPCCDCDCVIL